MHPRILLGAALLGCPLVSACEATPSRSTARPPTSVVPMPSVSALPHVVNTPDQFGANVTVREHPSTPVAFTLPNGFRCK